MSGASQVAILSTAGDADLFTIDDATFQAISSELVNCASENGTSLDVCTLDSSEEGAYAIVFGFTDAEFTISTQSVLSDPTRLQSLNSDPDESSSSGFGGLSFWFLLCLPLLLLQRRMYASHLARYKK